MVNELTDLGWNEVAAGEEYVVMATDQIESRWSELGYEKSSQTLQILKAYQHPLGFTTRETIYRGLCPDIKTFKQLTKLLSI